MGTQQILLIVLSVIIVGVAIAVGITMFRNQAYNSNATSLAAEMQTYASQVVTWYKTPTSQGGKGQGTVAAGDATALAAYLGFDGANNSLTTDSGEYRLTSTAADKIILNAIGKEVKDGKKPRVTTEVTIPGCVITSTPQAPATAL